MSTAHGPSSRDEHRHRDPQHDPSHGGNYYPSNWACRGRRQSALLPRLLRRLLASGADARKLQRMTQAGIAALLRDLVLEALDHAFVDRLHFMARPADQIMMMV